MHSLKEMAKALNRSLVYLSSLQKRFELPVLEGATYSNAYAAFLRGAIALRAFEISEQSLRELWQLERKLLQLLHVDSTGSRTWFLDSCGTTTHRDRRLLLSNHDLGASLTAGELQLGLNFADSRPELFAGREMGEDALRVLRECLQRRHRILVQIATGLPHLRAAVHWAKPLAGPIAPSP